MKISQLWIENFRGIRKASLLFPDHAVLIGDNNVGKSTILEALDLAMGPDRLSRPSPIDEHDFHLGRYLAEINDKELTELASEDDPLKQIVVTVVVSDLSEEQRIHFGASGGTHRSRRFMPSQIRWDLIPPRPFPPCASPSSANMTPMKTTSRERHTTHVHWTKTKHRIISRSATSRSAAFCICARSARVHARSA